MPKLTPEQIAKIRQKEAGTPDALKRDPLNDYTEGWFHVTLNTRGNAPILGVIMGDADVPDGSPNAPRCVPTQLGKKVEESWKSVTTYYPEVEIDAFIAMPEHIHGLLHLKKSNRVHLGQIIRGFMIGCTHGYWDTLGIAWGRNEKKKSGIPQVNTDRDHTRSFRGPALFVRGYNDVEAIGEEQIEIKLQYIQGNPRKRLIQSDKRDFFRKYRHLHSRNWTAERVMRAVSEDPSLRYSAERCSQALAKVAARLNTDATGICLDYIGSTALLSVTRKLPLICHRRDAHLFEQQKAAVLRAAREEGAVIVSAFISPRERDIRQQLMVEQLPFIEIMDNGIPEKYKGIGKAFYAIAEERLCQITPWRYEYQRDSQISREMCMVMNALACIISGVDDDWWK